MLDAWELLTPGITMVVCYSMLHASTARKLAVCNAVIGLRRDEISSRPSPRRRQTRSLRLLQQKELV